MIGRFTGAQNVIVKVLLPQSQSMLLLIQKRGFLFETFGKIEEVAGGGQSNGKKMYMIRRHTKGVYDKLMPDGFISQEIGNPSSFIACKEKWLTVFATHCNEEPFFADVFVPV